MMKSVVFSASSFSSGKLGNCLSGKFHSARDRGVEDSAQLRGVGAIYRRKKGCDHRPRTVLNTSES